MSSDLKAYTNCSVVTMNPQQNTAEAICWKEGKIVDVGNSNRIESLVKSQGGEIIDLNGYTVLPGFSDSHVHMMMTGLNQTALDVYSARSVNEVLKLIRKEKNSVEEGNWIYVKGLDEARLKEDRPPMINELDEVAPNHPVFILDRGAHYQVVNSAGWNRLNLDKNTPGLRMEDGEFNGRIQEEGKGEVRGKFFDSISPENRRKAIREAAKLAASKGLTSVHACEGAPLFADSDVEIINELKNELPVRTTLFWNNPDISKVATSHMKRSGEILLDGSIGSRTACFDEYYADRKTKGELNYTNETVYEKIKKAYSSNIQLAFHCIGEKAIQQVLDCYEIFMEEQPDAVHKRDRLEHFGVPRKEDIFRAAQLGLIISTQPIFAFRRSGKDSVYSKRLGLERIQRAYPIKSLLDAGLIVAGGSDSDVCPIDPLLGLHSCLNHPIPEQRISIDKALKLFTLNPQLSIHRENDLGTLEVSKLADMVVLNENPLETTTEIQDLEVVRTINNGNITYNAI